VHSFVFKLFFIFGDFNVDVSVPGYLCNYLYNVANLHAPTIIPTGHTHVSSSCATTIDLMLTTSPELVKNCQTVPPIGTSDHNGIISVVSLLTNTAAPQPSRKIWRYSHANFFLANELSPTWIPLIFLSMVIQVLPGITGAMLSLMSCISVSPMPHYLVEGTFHAWLYLRESSS